MMAADTSSLCSLCGKIDSVANLSECRDKRSWITLVDASKIREHEGIFSMPAGENGCPNISLCVITVHADRHLLIKRIC